MKTQLIVARISKELRQHSQDIVDFREHLANSSSYSNIQYETTYVAADSTLLATNHGTIPSLTLDPGESQTAQFREALPGGTALYTLKITGAIASK